MDFNMMILQYNTNTSILKSWQLSFWITKDNNTTTYTESKLRVYKDDDGSCPTEQIQFLYTTP